MTDDDIKKWFYDNKLGWFSGCIDSGKWVNEIWSVTEHYRFKKLLEYWETTNDITMTERMKRSVKFIRHKKLEDLGI